MGLDRFAFAQMLTLLHIEWLDKPSIISKGNILTILTHRNRSDSYLIITQDGNSLLLVCDIPQPEETSLVSRQYLYIIGMHHCAVYRLILFQSTNVPFFPEIKYPQEPILAPRIYNLIMFPKPHRRNIPLKMRVKRSLNLVRLVQIVDPAYIVHPRNETLFILRDFDPVGNQVQLRQIQDAVFVVLAGAWVPEADCTVVRAACQFQGHFISGNINNKYQRFRIGVLMKGGKLKQKHIEDFLQDIDDFKYGQKQKMSLQQHMTPPDIAAKLLFHIHNTEPLHQLTVADLGIGTGMLMCGLIYVGAQFVVGFEVDEEYIEASREMLEEKVDGADYELVLTDLRYMRMREAGVKDRLVDMVVMNPPFGTKQAGIDTLFLQFAMKICEGTIYSMHKSSTRKFLQKFCQERGYHMDILFQVKFPLKKRFKGYHKKDVAYTEVDILVITPTKELLAQRQKNRVINGIGQIKIQQNLSETQKQ